MNIYHGEDLRKGRISKPEQVYMVTAVTLNRLKRFNDDVTAMLLSRIVCESEQKDWCDILAYVVMPNHFHCLLQLHDRVSLSQLMQQIKGKSAHELNAYLQRKGSVWQKGFYEHAMRDEESIINAARYVVMNPVRASLVAHVGDYPYWNSSFLP